MSEDPDDGDSAGIDLEIVTLSVRQRFPRLPEPSRIRETSNTYSRIRFRLGVFSVPDLVLDSLSYLFSVSVLDLVSFKVCLSTGFGFGTVKDFSDSRFWIWYRCF